MAGELTILITLFLLAVPALLVQKFSRDKKLGRPFWQFGDFNALAIALVSLFAVIIIMNILAPEPDLGTPDKEIDFGKRRGIPQYVQTGYEKKMLKAPANLLYHFRALEARCNNLVAREPILIQTFFDRQVSSPEYYYRDLLQSADKDLRDAGHFGIAALYILRNSSKVLAEEELAEISDQHKPCVQYLRVLLKEEEHDPDSAIHFLKKEISNRGNIEQSTEKLARYYYWGNAYIPLLQLNQDPVTSPYVPLVFKQVLAFRNHHYLDYLALELERIFTKWNFAGVTGALLIFLVWLYYLRKIDLYEKERRRHVISILLLGCTFAVLVSYLYHYEHFYLNFHENGESWANDLLYYIAGVGFIEELIKIIPFLILLRFTKAVNEPMDYIIFGSLSALSFAFVENTLYFQEDSIYNIHARALWSVMMHVALTCMVTYPMMVAKWYPGLSGWRKSPYLALLSGLILAAAVHGLYDFFLLPQFSEAWVIPFFIVLTLIVVYTGMVNNCLNNSPFYTNTRNLNTDKLGAVLTTSLLGIILFEYICISFIYGIGSGNASLVYSLLVSWYLLMFLAFRLTGLDIFPGRWENLRFFASINPVAIVLRKKINYSRYIGREVLFNGGRKNAAILHYLPLKGRIVKREATADYAGWLLVDIDKPLIMGKKEYRQIWIRTEEENMPIENKLNTEVKIYLPRGTMQEGQVKLESDLVFIDRVLLN